MLIFNNSKATKYYFLLFQSMMNKLDLHQLETWTVIAWALRNALNKFYFRHLHQLQPKAFFGWSCWPLSRIPASHCSSKEILIETLLPYSVVLLFLLSLLVFV